MTIPFMYNFGGLSKESPTIFWSLIFHFVLPRLGYCAKEKPKIFVFKNVMERGMRKILTFERRENNTETLFQKANMKKDIKFRDASVLNL